MAISPSPTSVVSLCRDCLAEFERAQRTCTICGSDRMVSHPELGELTTAHIDCDAFYAAIEKRDNPELIDRPVLIGGGKRGVVSTACYVARKYGPRSAMPMYKALQMCPQAVVIRPNMAKYVEASRQVRAIFDSVTPIVEPLSLDEAFLDVSGTTTLFKRSAAATLAFVAREVERQVRISVSIGLSYNKFLAKIASDLDKPRGFAVIGQRDAISQLHDMPITKIPGVGPSLADRLKVDGFFSIGDLQAKSEEDLTQRYGDTGAQLARRARGHDTRRINTERESKSVSAETTFENDISDVAELRRLLWLQTERVSERLKKNGLAGQSIALKLKTARFKLVSRHRRLQAPTQLAETIFRAAEALLITEVKGVSYRLIGVGVEGLCDAELADHPDLFSDAPKHAAGVEKAMDAVRARFGRKAIGKGRAARTK
ncbi:MAG: DNA polymerase IV [Alphaproteobacteria bacterium]|nr:DNA polymerase IV [Alphaproteobacteria bacterium]PHY01553.1 MAG: DNA polymerase IV [Rhodospirillaceae bacterium]